MCVFKILLPPFPSLRARTVGGPGTSTSYSKSDPWRQREQSWMNLFKKQKKPQPKQQKKNNP